MVQINHTDGVLPLMYSCRAKNIASVSQLLYHPYAVFKETVA
jgi:hypothetical protein